MIADVMIVPRRNNALTILIGTLFDLLEKMFAIDLFSKWAASCALWLCERLVRSAPKTNYRTRFFDSV